MDLAVVVESKANPYIGSGGTTLGALPFLGNRLRPILFAVADELLLPTEGADPLRTPFVVVRKEFEVLTSANATSLAEFLSTVAVRRVGVEIFFDVLGIRANPPLARLVDTHSAIVVDIKSPFHS